MKQQNKDGIALVIVLGFLSMLTILAVGFLISMRTERIASNSYQEMQRGSHLLDVVLAYCIEDIDGIVSNKIYPSFDVRASSLSTNDSVAYSKWSQELLKYVPKNLTNDVDNLWANPVSWEMITANINGKNEDVGRCAYVIVNCSGLIDANYCGSSGSRGKGTNVSEIAIGSLPEISNEGDYLADRAQDVKYISLVDLWIGNSEIWKNEAENLFPFSYFPPCMHFDGVNFANKFDISVSENDLKNDPLVKQNIIDRFTECGITVAAGKTMDDLYDNLIDYVDNDWIPQNLNSFCTEAVPLINEIVYTNLTETIPSTPVSYDNSIYIHIETWYPFANVNTEDYYLVPTITVPASYTMVTSVVGKTLSTGVNTYDDNLIVYKVTGLPTPPAAPIPITLSGITITDSSNTPVDVVNFASPLVWNGWGAIYSEDPRINWDGNDSTQWKTEARDKVTLGKANTNGVIVNEGKTIMAVRNDPIENAAELGYLSVGEPWSTIRLYNPNLNPVLDYFTDSSQVTNCGPGYININSDNIDAVAAGLVAARYSPYGPIYTGTNEVSNATARAWATSIVSTNNSTNTSISIIGANATTLPGTTDAEIESAIANVHRLFNYRQQIYTVLMIYQGLNNGNVVSEGNAVAVIWRDPVPKGLGAHPAFVRYVKVLDQ